MVYILMGVSGAGKTVIGQKLADYFGIPFYDGDDFHPTENIQKMERGEPLTDEDRMPWLQILANSIQTWNQHGDAVLACSALKKAYRNKLRGKTPENEVRFIYLKGSFSLIADRLSSRSDHFMPEELLQSQFEALEEPERAITVPIDRSPEVIVQMIVKQLKSTNP